MRIIKLNQSDLKKIIEKVIEEQTGPGITSYSQQLSRPKPTKIDEKYPCVPKDVRIFVDYVMTNKEMLSKFLKIDVPNLIFLTKSSIGIIGRETKFGKVQELGDRVTQILRSSGAGSFLDWVYKKVGKSQSLGIGQFKPETWKKYGLDKTIGDFDKSFNQVSQGLGVLYTLTDRYKRALSNGLKPQPSINPILSKYGLVKNINGTGNNALDMSILSHNFPEKSVLYPYCTTNHPLYAAPCYKTKHLPYDTKQSFDNQSNKVLLQKVNDPRLKQFPGELTVSQNSKIDNYFPNLKGPNHTAIGYVEEVSKYIRSLGCIK